jgi:cytochrome b6-f complex iron-sulfur subunit
MYEHITNFSMKTNPELPELQQHDPETQSRGDFLRSLGLSSAALMAYYCLGTSLTSCAKEEATPTPTTPASTNGITGTTSGSNINFTVDLTNTANAGLKNAGGSLKVGDVFIANAKSGYVALQRLCPHANQDGLSYRTASDDILCTVHGSVFKTNGTVSNGPAATALKVYSITASNNGNTLTVKA